MSLVSSRISLGLFHLFPAWQNRRSWLVLFINQSDDCGLNNVTFFGKNLAVLGSVFCFIFAWMVNSGNTMLVAETISSVTQQKGFSSETALRESWVRLDSDVIEDVKNGRSKLALPQARAWEVCLPSKNWGNDRTTGQESSSWHASANAGFWGKIRFQGQSKSLVVLKTC